MQWDLCNRLMQDHLKFPADFFRCENVLWYLELHTCVLLRIEYTAFKDERFGLELFVCERLCVGSSYQHVAVLCFRPLSQLFISTAQSHLLLWRLEDAGCVSRPAFTDRATLTEHIVNNRAMFDDKY